MSLTQQQPVFLLSLILLGISLPGRPVAQLGEDLLNPANKVRKIKDGFRFLEGPIADSAGNVYFTDLNFSNLNKNQIYFWTLDNKITLFLDNAEGSNGLYLDGNGALIACMAGSRRVASISSTGEITEIASQFEGKRLNSPNDLWVDGNNGIYFTDPRYGSSSGVELGFHVYYIKPDRSGITLVIDDLVTPNGIIGTPDGKILYVADHGGKKTYKYSITGPGTLSGKTLFAGRGSDGMALDEKGNLYLTSGKVHVYSPAGEQLGGISVPESPANATFGGAEGRTLFITARTGLYALDMEVRGAYQAEPAVSLANKLVSNHPPAMAAFLSMQENQIFISGNFKPRSVLGKRLK